VFPPASGVAGHPLRPFGPARNHVHDEGRRASVLVVPQPVLRTERLLLVPLADRHLDPEVELDSDPEVLRFLHGRARSRAEVVKSHADRMALGRRVDGLGYWVAFGHRVARGGDGERRGPSAPDREDDGEFVGLMMLPPVPDPDQPGPDQPGPDQAVCELGYRLGRRWWGRGLATEASRVLLEHAFDTLAQDRVIARTMAVNAGSRGVMRALGMRYARTLHQHWDDPLPGSELGEVEYEMTREMWRAG